MKRDFEIFTVKNLTMPFSVCLLELQALAHAWNVKCSHGPFEAHQRER